jgi:hypothetical protein
MSVAVNLFCPEQNTYHKRTTSDISPCGLFVSGSPCGHAGREFDVTLECPENEPLCFRAQVARTSSHGFGMRLTDISPGHRERLERLVEPDWDGEDIFEGLLIFASREHVVDLAGWLRLTSLVCREYRRCAQLHSRSRLLHQVGPHY